MNRYTGWGVFVLFVCFVSAALAACLSDQREVTGTAAGASTATTSYCTYEDGTWTCGWMPERRSVELVEGVRLVQDIVFTTRLHGARKVRTGKLTVRTTPPCEVFLGGRRLTETPFTDMEFEPATYTLVFKHPQHAAVTRRVTIAAGKTTRLSFTLR